MAETHRAVLLPGAPGWALAVPLAALGAAPSGMAVWATSGTPPTTAGYLVVAAVQLALAAVLAWRSRRGRHEHALWARLAVAGLIGAVAVLASGVLLLLPVPAAVVALPVTCAPVLAFPFAYGGLVRWNRYSTSLADPNDVLNGSAAVLAVVALLNVVVDRTGHELAGLPWWRLQPLLAQDASLFVIAGTAFSMVFLGAMGRDPRTWLVVGAFTVQLSGSAATTLAGGEPVLWAGAAGALSAVCLGLAALWSPPPSTPQPADPTASTVGAFIVIIASTAILVAGAVSDTAPELATWCAAIAATGSSVRLLVNVRELAQLAVSRREALTDELTGLANRRAVLRRVEELCDQHEPVVVALLDLDKFKEVNDGLGHSAGDDLLRLVAARLEPVLAPVDVVGRLGGDEFAVVVRVPDGTRPADHAVELGRALHRQLAEPFEVGGLSLHVSVSVGLTHAGGAAAGAGDGQAMRALLLRQADAAMYDAKRSGEQVVVYDGTRHLDSSGHLALVEEMRHGLATGQFVLHHQPQLDIATGRTLGVEALVRWAHPMRGLLAPADFLSQAEVHGLMGALTDTVLTQAVAQAATWRRAGLDLRVSVNLSASNLLDTGLPRRVADLLEASAVPPSAIVLEVTESVLLSDPDRSLAVVAALAALGTTVSIDDFGTGYASLTYLRALPVAELKLDRSFTADLLTDARAAAIIASTIGLAHQLGLRVVAEGVEDHATLRDLRLLGCDESQGYLHSPPLPAAELEVWLRAQRVDPVPALLG
ncbi:putative bifunctional diguanylate cyclase/phosphodiesterase [Modestobacter altitudinis]|uniref:putative bifunctional diguanylate cyclase/phosphodiesterase n=1 Tax=Modestobacter altitudinis TaxID=2213158 RepID=UPI00110C9E0C|nr:EAL domain-containing protein [Modestobacter altitudinis]